MLPNTESYLQINQSISCNANAYNSIKNKEVSDPRLNVLATCEKLLVIDKIIVYIPKEVIISNV